MKYLILTTLALLTLSAPAQAQETHEDIQIQVDGMVCDFCAQSVWKVMEDYEGVTKIDINLDTGIVTVHMNPGATLSDDKLGEAITYAGYDLVNITRTQSAEQHS